jgi:hypothetical protein
MMLGFAYLIASRNVLSVIEAMTLLCISGTVSAAVCVLQGQFGMFMSLMPPVHEWDRMYGLTEWPIEAGTVSSVSIVIAVGLIVYRRRAWPLLVLLAAINIYSMKYSASLTAVFQSAVGVIALAVLARAYRVLVVLGVAVVLILAVALPAGLLGKHLGERLEIVLREQGNYQTVQSREDQWRKTADEIDARTALFGNGFSRADLPSGLDIHNGALAAVFHFGVAGLASQCLLIWFFVARIFGPAPRALRSILLGCVITFLMGYVTAPPYARRTGWVPMFVMGAYLLKWHAARRESQLVINASSNA